VCETGTVEVLQTLSCPVQLLPPLSEGNGRESGVTYQLQPVDCILPDVLHDVPVSHPFRHRDKLAFLYVLLNAGKLQDVRMG